MAICVFFCKVNQPLQRHHKKALTSNSTSFKLPREEERKGKERRGEERRGEERRGEEIEAKITSL
jgi:hypothetical protein